MDKADLAQEQIDLQLAAALAARNPAGPVATGRCLSCGVEVEAGRRWCSADCRDDWQLVQRGR
jgi:hypothetical protein